MSKWWLNRGHFSLWDCEHVCMRAFVCVFFGSKKKNEWKREVEHWEITGVLSAISKLSYFQLCQSYLEFGAVTPFSLKFVLFVCAVGRCIGMWLCKMSVSLDLREILHYSFSARLHLLLSSDKAVATSNCSSSSSSKNTLPLRKC